IALDDSLRGEGGSPTGGVAGVVLQHSNSRPHRVDRASAVAQDRRPGLESIAQSLPRTLLMIFVAMDRAHRTCATMNYQLPGDTHGGVPSHRGFSNPRPLTLD